MEYDTIDQKLLLALRHDGRKSHSALAKEVGLSSAAVGERIKKLERSGVILGYQAVFNPDALDLGICAFVSIAPQPRNPNANLVRSLLAQPEIEELHAVAGRYGYIAKVRVKTTEDLDGFLDRLWILDGVERTESAVVLRTNVERNMFLPFAEPEDGL